jgi:hypothetical protein
MLFYPNNESDMEAFSPFTTESASLVNHDRKLVIGCWFGVLIFVFYISKVVACYR